MYKDKTNYNFIQKPSLFNGKTAKHTATEKVYTKSRISPIAKYESS